MGLVWTACRAALAFSGQGLGPGHLSLVPDAAGDGELVVRKEGGAADTLTVVRRIKRLIRLPRAPEPIFTIRQINLRVQTPDQTAPLISSFSTPLKHAISNCSRSRCSISGHRNRATG